MMHSNQLAVPLELVQQLVWTQFPVYRLQKIERFVSEGTVNAIFRIGDDLAARFPLLPGDVGAVERTLRSESEASQLLFGRTRFATPVTVAIGRPGFGYPLPWTIQKWIAGSTGTVDDPGSSVGFATDLAEFVAAVRAIPTGGRSFCAKGRGGDLRNHDAWVYESLARSTHLFNAVAVKQLWLQLRDLPRPTGIDVMTHGDLTPGNVLVNRGRLTGVIDVGGLGPADPALDLVGAWHLLDIGPRIVFRKCLSSSDIEWARGAAWALEQAVGACWYYEGSNPAMHRMGLRTIDRILADSSIEASAQAQSTLSNV